MPLSYGKFFSFWGFKLTLYCLLFTVTIFTNKYILSTLKFTYPTVFQGWQTLFASLFLFVMKLYSEESSKLSVHGYGIISMLPCIVFHVCGIVAGSKALSMIPVSIFLGTTNVCNVAVLLSLNKPIKKLHFILGGVTFTTSVVLLLSHQLNMYDLSNVWLITHIFFLTVDILYSNFIDLKISQMKKLWYKNIFSVMILAPASLYLQEAFSALEFALTNQLKFYICVFISGLCGGVTQVLSMHFDCSNLSQSYAVIVTCVLSQITFIEDALSGPFLYILVINLISNSMLSIYNTSERVQGELAVV